MAGEEEEALASRVRGQRRGSNTGEPRRVQRRSRRHGESVEPRGTRPRGGGRRRVLTASRKVEGRQGGFVGVVASSLVTRTLPRQTYLVTAEHESQRRRSTATATGDGHGKIFFSYRLLYHGKTPSVSLTEQVQSSISPNFTLQLCQYSVPKL
jgi:hypothetical protein